MEPDDRPPCRLIYSLLSSLRLCVSLVSSSGFPMSHQRDDNLPPNFLIPVGTQVVLRYDRRVPGTDQVKPAGTVAEVVESPASNDRPYLVRFLDGASFRLKFGELLV